MTQSTKDQKPCITVGGQALIEGVMMRSPNRISIAVKKPDGDVDVRGWQFISAGKKYKILGIPIVRGAVSLVETLYWGMKTLELSAQIATGESDVPPKKSSSLISVLSMVLGLVIGLALFAFLPLQISGWIGLADKPFYFNLVAGAVRVTVFMCYLIAISFLPDVKRLFKYHGAEHKTIFSFEKGEPLTTDRVQKNSTFHPRCGTSFLIIVAVISIAIFAIFDGLLKLLFDFAPKPIIRLPIHLLLVPLVAGISFEFLKLSDKLSKSSVIGKIIVAPGLWVQRITTSEPDDKMVEIAVAAMMDSIKEISMNKN
jgi:uncharacterized protein YqhQ